MAERFEFCVACFHLLLLLFFVSSLPNPKSWNGELGYQRFSSALPSCGQVEHLHQLGRFRLAVEVEVIQECLPVCQAVWAPSERFGCRAAPTW